MLSLTFWSDPMKTVHPAGEMPNNPTTGHFDAAHLNSATLPQTAVSSLVKIIKAHLEKAKQAEEKSEQHYISAGLRLAELKDRYRRDVKVSKTQTWEQYVHETFGLGRSRADELIRIADGRATLEDTRAIKAASVAKSKAKVPKTAASSGGPSVAVCGDANTPELASHQSDPDHLIAQFTTEVRSSVLDIARQIKVADRSRLIERLREVIDEIEVEIERWAKGARRPEEFPDMPACLRRT